jgi:peptidoglycan/LPS O-acetylase OafA/YrhL
MAVVSARTTKSSKRADIQGLRAVAVLLVVFFHAGVDLPGGFTGVDVFFAISGFVITSVLVAELDRTNRLDLPRFYARRVKRLLPALALMLAVVAVLGILATPAVAQRTAALSGVSAALFSANIYLFRLGTGYFDVQSGLNPLVHTWTLAVEEQFYIFFPALLLLGWSLFGRRRGSDTRRIIAAAVVLGISIASFALAAALAAGWTPPGIQAGDRFAFYGSPARAWEFGAGAVLAILVTWLRRIPRPLAFALSLSGAAAILAGAFIIKGTAGFPGLWALFPVGGTGALLVAGTAQDVGAYPLLESRPAVWIGDLSYSWYLWHWPLIVYARALVPGAGWAAPVAAFTSLLPAWASYRYVENPIRFNPLVRGWRVVALGTGCVLVGVLASAGLAATRSELNRTAAMRQWARAQAWHADFLRGCDTATPQGQRRNSPCLWRVPEAKGNVVLIGDSNAGQFTEPFLRATNRAGYDATVATRSGCPYLELRVTGADGAGCWRSSRRSLAALIAMRPSLVVLASLTSWYLDTGSIGLGPVGGGFTHDRQAKRRLWAAALKTYLTRLNDAGVPVLLVHQVPMPPTNPAECAVVRVLLNRCEEAFPRSGADKERGPGLRTENAALGSATRAWSIDFEGEFCGETRCAARRGSTLFYRDQDHLTVEAAQLLTGGFYQAIRAHVRR